MKFSISTVLVLIGGIIVVVGGFMASNESSKAKHKLSDQNETILKLQEEIKEQSRFSLEYITGGESYPFIENHYNTQTGVLIFDSVKLDININGNYPVYDLSVSITELFLRKVERINNTTDESWDRRPILDKQIGTLSRTTQRLSLIKIDLPKDRIRHFQIAFRARNGEIVQELMYIYNEGKKQWEWSTFVFRNELGKNNNTFHPRLIYEKQSADFDIGSHMWFHSFVKR